MRFKLWLTNEDQSQDTLFMQTDKSTYPKPSSNGGLPKPSDGWFRGKAQPALMMKKKMKKEHAFYEEIDIDPYQKVAKEMVYLLDYRRGSRGENHDRSWVETETLKVMKRYFEDETIDWQRLEEMAKNAVSHLYRNYSEDFIRTQEARLDSLLAYLPKYFGGN